MNEFSGHPVDAIDNGKIRVEFLTDIGPRLVGLSFGKSGKNLFAELPELNFDTAFGPYDFLGGHRLWRSPESVELTYAPDQPVTIEKRGNTVHIQAKPEPRGGLIKSIEIEIASDRPSVTVKHVIQNQGAMSAKFAPWAISMLRLGGTMILPQPAAPTGEAAFLPNRRFVLWPYTQINDPRLQLGDDFILVRANASTPAAKLGYYNPHGWAAYWFEGLLFVKRFQVEPVDLYPDGGCNLEVYCNGQFIEFETLGSLTDVAPGATAVHTETWELYEGLDQDFIPQSLRDRLAA